MAINSGLATCSSCCKKHSDRSDGLGPMVVLDPFKQALDWIVPVKERRLLENDNVVPAALQPSTIRPAVGQHDGLQTAPASQMDQRCIDTGDQAVGPHVIDRAEKAAELVRDQIQTLGVIVE